MACAACALFHSSKYPKTSISSVLMLIVQNDQIRTCLGRKICISPDGLPILFHVHAGNYYTFSGIGIVA